MGIGKGIFRDNSDYAKVRINRKYNVHHRRIILANTDSCLLFLDISKAFYNIIFPN